MGLITLRRVRGEDGVVLWSDSFAVPVGAGDYLQVSDAVRQRLWRAFPERVRSPEPPAAQVSPADYLAFLELRQRIESGDSDRRQAIEQVSALLERSPRFLPGHLLMADLARSLFTSTAERSFLQRAASSVETAAELAPEDPRPLIWQARLLLADRKPDLAREPLRQAKRLVPGHPSIPLLRANLADLAGRPEEARLILGQAVESFPSWQNLYRLAALELRDGFVDAARRHLEDARRRAPTNPWVLGKLGKLELTHGNLNRAEDLFLELTRLDPDNVAFLLNLGLVRLLQRRYDEASVSFEQVLNSHPANATALLNLADAQLAGGRLDEARASYERSLQILDGEHLKPIDLMLKAQALAHLGHHRQAVRITQQTVERNPEHSEVLYLASLVYCLAGDDHSSVVAAERALSRGYQKIWYEIPAFDSLRDDPEFQALFSSGPA